MQACYSIKSVRLASGPGPQCKVVIVNANIDWASKAHLLKHPRCESSYMRSAVVHAIKSGFIVPCTSYIFLS